MNEQIRADFEKWWDKAGFNTQLLHWQGKDHYRDGTAQIAWQSFRAAHARYAGGESEADKPSVSWGIDWGRDGDQSCACIMKHYVDGTKEIVSVEYSPAQEKTRPAPAVPEGYVLVPVEPLREVLRISDRKHDAWDAVKAAMLTQAKGC